MIGAFYLPVDFAAHETGLTIKQVNAAFTKLTDAGFCFYDTESEHVFVFKMGRCRVGQEVLNPRDKRWMAAKKLYERLPATIKASFFTWYGKPWQLPEPEDDTENEGASKGPARGIEAPSEGHKRGIEAPSKPVISNQKSGAVSGTGSASAPAAGAETESTSPGAHAGINFSNASGTTGEGTTEETPEDLQSRIRLIELKELIRKTKPKMRWGDKNAPAEMQETGLRVSKREPVLLGAFHRLMEWQGRQ